MEDRSAFNKHHVETTALSETSGLLDQLNLPQGFIKYVRKNQKTIKTAAICITTIVVVVTLYGSYRQNMLNKAATALAVAMSQQEDSRSTTLNKVAEEFSSTPSALWAKTEIAHLDMSKGEYKTAVSGYQEVRKSISSRDPMFSLLTYGIARALEAGSDFDAALTEYTSLKETPGYKAEAFAGMARIYEQQNKPTEALNIYQQHLATFTNRNPSDPVIQLLEEKIARLQAR